MLAQGLTLGFQECGIFCCSPEHLHVQFCKLWSAPRREVLWKWLPWGQEEGLQCPRAERDSAAFVP